MLESERTSETLSFDELLKFSGDDREFADEPATKPDKKAVAYSHDTLLNAILGGMRDGDAQPLPPKEEPALVTLASLFDTKKESSQSDPEQSVVSFSLAAAFGVPEEAAAPIEPVQEASLDVASLFGLSRDEVVVSDTPSQMERKPEPKQKPKTQPERLVRSRFADLPVIGGPQLASSRQSSEPQVSKPVVALEKATLPVSSAASRYAKDVFEAATRKALPAPREEKPALELAESKPEAFKSASPKAASAKPAATLPAVVHSEQTVIKEQLDTAVKSEPEVAVTKPMVSRVEVPVVSVGQNVDTPDGGIGHSARRGHALVSVVLVIAAVLAGVVTVVVALDGGTAIVQNETTPLALLAGGAQSHGAGSVEYRYKVKGSGEGMGQANEIAVFNQEGFLSESSITVEFSDDEQAQLFLDDALSAFGDLLTDSRTDGSVVSFVVKAAGESVDRDAYTELLRRDTVDCEVIAS